LDWHFQAGKDESIFIFRWAQAAAYAQSGCDTFKTVFGILLRKTSYGYAIHRGGSAQRAELHRTVYYGRPFVTDTGASFTSIDPAVR
jgi:hypothetical protein